MSKYRIKLDGKVYEMEIERIDSSTGIVREPSANPVVSKPADQDSAVQTRPTSDSAPGVVKSMMPGTVIQVKKAPGNAVKKGQCVLILEAMKMENEIVSPCDGIISAIFVNQGDAVQGGESLFEITA